ncbi:hypothetical protein CSA56_09625 [candidate division KSB3 bacterium]|uniref:Uncharacterized protein n=1 Tax=candidate division KSB3 bacterium TaxID=2044937 RepID=A0A2G6KE74_9BACT|nr:MAG: hypothetical protein CSA56_09625 [candidate division KSB3 bacterium]
MCNCSLTLLEGRTPLQCTIIVNVLQAQRNGDPVGWVVTGEDVTLERNALWVPKNLQTENIYWGWLSLRQSAS